MTVQIFELDCEYAYSAPTGRFNLQVPHIEARNLYQNQSYSDYKRSLYLEAEKKANADLEAETSEQQAMSEEDPLHKRIELQDNEAEF